MDKIRLKFFGLPIIESIEDFSQFINISKSRIFVYSKNNRYFYKTYSIPKKNGKKRTICEPSKGLKGVQAWILNNILNKLSSSEFSKGFEPNLSLNDNLRPHVGASAVLNIDLKDFFKSITDKRVFILFKSIGYNDLISTVLTNLCTYDGYLPQGSPCSPKIANLICWNLDIRIQGLVGKFGIVYTRYADDMSFSGLVASKLIKSLPIIKAICLHEGFELNSKKTRIMGKSRSLQITGLILYKGKYGVGRKKYRELRVKIHQLVDITTLDDTTHKSLHHLEGWLSYLNDVDKVRYSIVLRYINKLLKIYPDSVIKSLIPSSKVKK